jgi:hypothetical protein
LKDAIARRKQDGSTNGKTGIPIQKYDIEKAKDLF